MGDRIDVVRNEYNGKLHIVWFPRGIGLVESRCGYQFDRALQGQAVAADVESKRFCKRCRQWWRKNAAPGQPAAGGA